MAIDKGPSKQPVKQKNKYKQGVFGLVRTTFNLWLRKLPQYAVIVGITGTVLLILQSMILLSIFGVEGFDLLELIGTAPLDVVLNLLIYDIPVGILVLVVILSVIGLAVYAVVAGAAIHFALTDYESPNSGDIRESFSFVFDRIGTLVGVQLLESIVVVGLAFVAGLVMVMFDIFVGIALFILVIYIGVRLAPAQAVAIAEDRGAMESLTISWYLTGGQFWHVFFGQIVMSIAFFVIEIAVGVMVGVFAVIFFSPTSILIATLISSFLLSSSNYIYFAVLFRDLEARGPFGNHERNQ